jgi:hypothetical protein
MARKPPRYEGSARDNAEDAVHAGLLGITPQQYEKHPMDMAQDVRGQGRLNAATAIRAAMTAAIASHRGKKR